MEDSFNEKIYKDNLFDYRNYANEHFKPAGSCGCHTCPGDYSDAA
jgi:hypothetical protein